MIRGPPLRNSIPRRELTLKKVYPNGSTEVVQRGQRGDTSGAPAVKPPSTPPSPPGQTSLSFSLLLAYPQLLDRQVVSLAQARQGRQSRDAGQAVVVGVGCRLIGFFSPRPRRRRLFFFYFSSALFPPTRVCMCGIDRQRARGSSMHGKVCGAGRFEGGVVAILRGLHGVGVMLFKICTVRSGSKCWRSGGLHLARLRCFVGAQQQKWPPYLKNRSDIDGYR